MDNKEENMPDQRHSWKKYKSLLTSIGLVLPVICGMFWLGAIYQENKDNIEIATLKLKVQQLEFENNELKKKIEEIKDENEEIKKENNDLKIELKNAGIKIPPKPPKSNTKVPPSNKCKDIITVFIKNSLTKSPIKQARVFNGGGRNFQTGFTDDEGKLTLIFSTSDAQYSSLIFVSADKFQTFDTKLNLCQTEQTITIFLQPK